MASMILVPLLVLVIVLGIGYYYFTSALETSTLATIKRVVEDHRQMIESFLSERRANLEFILRTYTYEQLSNPKVLKGVFENLQQESGAFIDLGVFNAEGIHVAYEGPYHLAGKPYSHMDWFKEVLRDGYYMSDVYLGYRRVPHFIIALSKEGEREKWMIRATIDTHLFNELVKRVRIGKTGEAYLLNADRVFQTERRSGGSLMERHPEALRIPESQEGTLTFIDKDARGDEYLYATTRLKSKPWALVVRQERADAFYALRSATYMIVLAMILGGSAVVGIAFYLTNRIVRRMERLDAEKDRLKQQLISASRLAELGEMSAGFAHEINNPLQIMKSEQTLIETVLSDLKERGELKPSEDLKELEDSVRQISIQIDRCGQITQSILKFGRQSEPKSQLLDLRMFVPEVIGMVIKRASVQGIQVEHRIQEDTPLIYADTTQLQQVLLNLCNNAIDAIVSKHGSSGGSLVVGCGPDEKGDLILTVTDNGMGIRPENLEKIFAPFFTTKPVGKGTGLGLSVCYGIIESMGGTMEVGSEEGLGTTFTIHLPVAS